MTRPRILGELFEGGAGFMAQSTRRELLGYADRLSVAPGESVRFMVSSEFPSYDAMIVRLIHGDNNPDGPGYKEEEINTSVTGTYPGSRQATYTGSYIAVPASAALDAVESLTLQAWIYPTTPVLGREQGILGRWSSDGKGYGLVLDEQGRLTFRVGGARGAARQVRTSFPLRQGQWYFVAASYDASTGTARLWSDLVKPWPLDDARALVEASEGSARPAASGPFLIGAANGTLDARGRLATNGHFNGKIDRPKLFGRALDDARIEALRGASGEFAAADALVAAWSFTTDFASARVTDSSPNGLHGTAVNRPARAVIDHTWNGTKFSHVEAPEQYGAIHFHDDDLEDSGWEVAFELTVPEGTRSGIYAARIRAGNEEEDHIPFYVRPKKGTATAPIAFLAPVNSYLAYANESLAASDQFDFTVITNIPIEIDRNDRYVHTHPEVFKSIYDSHTDGSGIDYSSYLRPILTMRPKHRYWIINAARHFAADLYLNDWLEAKGFQFDVITDLDLHFEGKELLDRYKVIITGSHPEYWTTPMMDALEAYENTGGRLMYLGGNGFYWVTGVDPERPHIVEVRRGYAGIRSWESHPGETYMASTGEKGALWRHRGRAPNTVAGIGFVSQGWDLKTPGFKQLPDRDDPRASWIFEGIGKDEIIGDFGLVMSGASGDELDAANVKLGTPPHALVLATSAGMHSDYYLLVVEEIPLTIKNIDGTNNPLIRGDIVYYETAQGGAVFAAGSISFSGSLSWNNYDNNVSRMTENVLRRFSV